MTKQKAIWENSPAAITASLNGYFENGWLLSTLVVEGGCYVAVLVKSDLFNQAQDVLDKELKEFNKSV